MVHTLYYGFGVPGWRARLDCSAPFATRVENVLKFTAKGLKLKDVVVLSGAHTIGFSQCKNFKLRLYIFSGTGKPDVRIDPNFLRDLQTTCPKTTSSDTNLVPLDSSSSRFDNKYYSNIADHKSILSTDQGLMGDPVATSMIRSYSLHPDLWIREDGQYRGALRRSRAN